MPSQRTSPRSDLLRRVHENVPEASVVAKFERLLAIVEELGSCVLALSGGIDSSFLLAVAAPVLGGRCVALTGDSPAVPSWDRAGAGEAAAAAAEFGARWRSVPTKELDDPRYAGNPRSRCFFCKIELYGAATAVAREEGAAWVVDGTNASDLGRPDRPGIDAGAQLRVRSPLAEAGIGKDEVRVLARAIGVPDWDRPASACLSSRIPFGEPITVERLRRVEAAELALRSIGFRQVRVRDFTTHARVEVEDAALEDLARQREVVGARLEALGFASWSSAPYRGLGAGDSPDAGR